MRHRTVKPFSILPLFILLWTSVSHSSANRLMDETGRQVAVPVSPTRIVSLAPNVTEILFGLGLDREIVGVSIHCNFPEKVKGRERVGSYISLDFEKIVSLRPDLIIGTGAGNTRDMVQRLESLGFPTYVIFPKNYEDIVESIYHIGQVVHREKEAMAIIQDMTDRKAKVIERIQNLPRPRVFLQIGEAPIVTVGKGSFADDLIHLAGGENIAGKEEKRYPRIGMEDILKKSPEVILISAMDPDGNFDRVLQGWARWTIIPAVKHGRIHVVDSDLIDRPSLRIIQGLEVMARLLHPEQFKK